MNVGASMQDEDTTEQFGEKINNMNLIYRDHCSHYNTRNTYMHNIMQDKE